MELEAAVAADPPDVVVTDIRMPPTGTDEGLRAATWLHDRYPEVGVVVLSQHVNPDYAVQLLGAGAGRRAYLLKDRVSDVDELVRAIREVAGGGSVIDPRVIEALVSASRTRPMSPLDRLTPREGEVLAAMAQPRGDDGSVDKVKVLVVDDQAPFRMAAKATLVRTPGFTMVGEAADGTEVLEAAAATGADLVLMDVNMPLMNGIDATRGLLAARPGTVVFLCSTYLIGELPDSARTSGARGYVNKEDLSPQLLADLWARAVSSSPADGLLTG